MVRGFLAATRSRTSQEVRELKSGRRWRCNSLRRRTSQEVRELKLLRGKPRQKVGAVAPRKRCVS